MTVVTDRGLTIPMSLDDMLVPAKAVLLVYDMQVGILSQIKEGDRVVANVQKLIAAARAAGLRIIFTRHMSMPTALMGVMQYRTAMAWQHVTTPGQVHSPFLPNSPGFQLLPSLPPSPDDAVIDKITMSAFESTPLALLLRDCGITAVVMCGVALEVGIEPSLRHAADLGFIPIVVTDACGAGQPSAATRSLEGLRFSGDTMFTTLTEFCSAVST